MNVTVKLFAAAKQRLGAEEVQVAVPDGATVADLRDALASQHPKLEQLSQHAMFAIDTEYAEPRQELTENDEIAMIPPVSGG